MYGPTKVGDFDFAVDSDQYILGFNVSVHDMFLVQVLEGRSHLSDVLRSLPFWETPFFAQMLVQLTLTSEFEDEEHSLAVVEVAEESENIRVSQIGLDLDFSPDLLLDFALLQL
jgi:hypothetical protein